MRFRAKQDEIECYREQGFFTRESVLGESDLTPVRAAVEEIHRKIRAEAVHSAPNTELIDDKRYQAVLGSTIKWEWAEGSEAIRSMEPVHHLHPAIDRLIDDPRIWQPCLDILGTSEVSLFTDKLNFKRPQGSPFPWHQDTPYWAFGCEHVDRLASVQIYLDDANLENGCLWMIAGSHRHGVLPPLKDRGVMGNLYTDISSLDREAFRPIEAPAGSLIYFHGDIVHGSRTNQTRESRRALVLTYQPAGLPQWRLEGVRPLSAAQSV